MSIDPQTAAQAAASNATVRDDLIKGFALGWIGLVGTLLTLLVGWLKDRDTLSKRIRHLEEATKRVAFWDSWLKAMRWIRDKKA